MIKVLRLGHRLGRDDRISTHVGLTARQWGAEEIVFAGEKDENMLESQRDIIERWGGELEIRYTDEWKNEIRDFDGLKIHLTMYGEKINKNIEELKEKFSGADCSCRESAESSNPEECCDQDLLVVVGAEKVPRWVYRNVDQNISVGNQPHSEIAALAVFLDRIQDSEIKEDFEGADIEVEPSEDRKLTRETE